MAEWSRNKANSANINGGKEFTSDDDLSVAELNAMVNNSFYGVDFVEAMASEPDISEIAGDGTPSVSLADNGKFKRFKFSNLKGSKGDTGEKGDKGDKGETGDTVPNTLTIGTVEGGETASATITGTAPNQVLNLVLPKGDKGDTGAGGLSRVLESGFTDRTSLYNRINALASEGITCNIIFNHPTNLTINGTKFTTDTSGKTTTATAKKYFYANAPVKFYGVANKASANWYDFISREWTIQSTAGTLTIEFRGIGYSDTSYDITCLKLQYTNNATGSEIVPSMTLEYYQ